MNNKDIEKTSQEIQTIEHSLQEVLKNRNDDYSYARDILYVTAEKLQDVLEAAVQMAQESEHPRAVEVAVQAANALADTAGKMMNHHVTVDKLNNPKGAETKQVTTNNLNVKLSTKDLLELLSRE